LHLLTEERDRRATEERRKTWSYVAHLLFVESSWHAIETRSRIPETEIIDIGKQHELA